MLRNMKKLNAKNFSQSETRHLSFKRFLSIINTVKNMSQGKETFMTTWKTTIYLKLVLLPFLLFSCKGADGGFAPSLIGAATTVSIAPVSTTIAVNNLETFSASGGTPPYTYSIFSGSGSVLSTTGSFTAAAVPGSTVVRATDSTGKFADAIVTINPALQISPTNQSLSLSATQAFTTTGGVAPFIFSLISGAGSIDANSGVYIAPAAPGSATIRVTDAKANTSSAIVNIYGALGISPTSMILAVNNSTPFSAGGGVGPYTFSVFSGTGIINASTGVYTAAATAGIATVRVTDSLGAIASSSVTINDALVISPTSQTTLINSSITFSQSGGVSPFIYSVIAGTGTIDSNTGVFSAPASNGSATVRVTDTLGNFSDANVTITTALSISPASTILAVNNTATFTAVGGTGPFTFSRFSGTGTVNAATGVYTAPAASGSAVVRVTDSLGAFADANVTVNAALAITPASQTMGINGTLNYSSTGGVVPYTYSVFSGGGVINATTGAFTAPATAGTTVVHVTDNFGNIASSNVTITSGLSISPASSTLAVNNTVTFVGANGATPYTYSVFSGTGTINAATGLYTAPATSGSAVVRVTDNLGAVADANVTINAALAIAPATKTLAVNNVFTFSATGGVSPYTYSVFSGGGTINGTTGAYTAPAAAGTAVVRVTDGLGNVSNSNVTINAALAISPTTATIASTGSQTYTSTGGVAPVAFSVASGPGSINATTGVYTPTMAGTVIVRVTDSLSNTSDGNLTVNGPLVVSPTTAYVVTNSDLALSPAGGVAPYTFSIVAGGGIIDSVTGVYTAGATAGTATLRTTDSAAPVATADTAVTIYNPLVMTPTLVTMGINTNQTFTASGGFGALTFSVYTGTGTVNATTGVFTAPAVSGVNLVHVTDTIGNIVEATVNVVSSLTISPQTLNLPVFSTMTYTSVLGTSPYTYSVFAGTGTVNATTGLYTAPGVIGSGTVRVTDSVTNTSDAAVTHIEPVEVSSGAYHTCVRYNNNAVKCFGDGATGQLGSGSTADLGDVTTEQGGNLPFVNLGTGRTAKALATGFYHSCAILDNNTLKCWGQNTYGQLGLGDITARGDGAGEMGDALPTVNLGAGRTALKVSAFGYVTCVILDNNATKCFGRNNYGQLGQSDIANRGTSAAQMGDTLLAVNFGTGRTATKIGGGLDFTCARLDNATVKCFGRANNGQIGSGNNVTLGDSAGEMGDSLVAVNLGTGRTAVNIASGYSHSCVMLDNSTVKCFGRNQSGQLGLGDATTRGGTAASMGDGLPAVPFGGGFVASQLVMGRQMSCAMNATGAVRCWGLNSTGQLLIGSTVSQGDNTGELAALVNMNYGTARTAVNFSIGYYMGCAVLDNKGMKCWGSAVNGALLNASITAHLGDVPGEVGDGLPLANH